MECPCHLECKDCHPGFQKLIDLKNAGLVLYRHTTHTEDVDTKTGNVEHVVDTTEDVYILHNTTDKDVTPADYWPEIEQNTIKCPRCKKIKEQARKLLKKGPTISGYDVKGICNHCKMKDASCYGCQEVVKSFMPSKPERTDVGKERVKHWLGKIKLLLDDTSKDKKISNSDIHTDQLFRNLKKPLREPDVEQLFGPKNIDSFSTIHPSTDKKKKVKHFPQLEKIEHPIIFKDSLKKGAMSESFANIDLDYSYPDSDFSKSLLHAQPGKGKHSIMKYTTPPNNREVLPEVHGHAAFEQIFEDAIPLTGSKQKAATNHKETSNKNYGDITQGHGRDRTDLKPTETQTAKDMYGRPVKLASHWSNETNYNQKAHHYTKDSQEGRQRKYNSTETLVTKVKDITTDHLKANSIIFPSRSDRKYLTKHKSSSELIKHTVNKLLVKTKEEKNVVNEHKQAKIQNYKTFSNKIPRERTDTDNTEKEKIEKQYLSPAKKGQKALELDEKTRKEAQTATLKPEVDARKLAEKNAAKADKESAKAEKDTLKVEKLAQKAALVDKRNAQAEKDAAKAKKDAAKAERDALKADKESAKAEKDALKAEKLAQKAALADERNAQAEKDAAKAKKEAAKAERDASKADKESAKAEKDALKAEKLAQKAALADERNAQAEKDAAKAKKDAAKAERDASKADKESAKAEKDALQAEKLAQKAALVDKRNAQAEKDAAKAKKDAAKAERDASKADKESAKAEKDALKAEKLAQKAALVAEKNAQAEKDAAKAKKDAEKDASKADKESAKAEKDALKADKLAQKAALVAEKTPKQVFKDAAKAEKDALQAEKLAQKAALLAEKNAQADKDAAKAKKDAQQAARKAQRDAENAERDALIAFEKSQIDDKRKQLLLQDKMKKEHFDSERAKKDNKKYENNMTNNTKPRKRIPRTGEKNNPALDELISKLVKLKQLKKNTKENKGKSHYTSPDLRLTQNYVDLHCEQHTHQKNEHCLLCANSDIALEFASLCPDNEIKKDLSDIIIGQHIIKFRPPRTAIREFSEAKDEEEHEEQKDNIPLKRTAAATAQNGIGYWRYSLSDRKFIDNGWTQLPTEKVVRKMNVYRMRPARPEFDWFEHNKNKGLIQYDTGEKLAEFDDSGRGRWFYRNGRMALAYYDAEEQHAGQRFVVYSNGEPDERGRSRPYTLLATFDYLGNGVVFDHGGKIRLKYNQTEGVVLDRSIGPVSHWKWHTLNDPPVLQQVMIDTQIAHKDSEIMKMGMPEEDQLRPDDEDMLAIEFDNIVKEKTKKLSQTFRPFQIRMKALKINEHFSLRVLDQATVYLLYRDGTTNLKLNIGMVLDYKEIVDTDTAEVGDVSNNLQKLPARTESLAGLQKSIAIAQQYDRMRTERERKLHPGEANASIDKLVAGISRPIPRQFITTVPSASPMISAADHCKCNRKPTATNMYYDTRFY